MFIRRAPMDGDEARRDGRSLAGPVLPVVFQDPREGRMIGPLAAVLGVLALLALGGWREHCRIRRQEDNEIESALERAHQEELLEETRNELMEGIDFELRRCACWLERGDAASDCRRCDDTGWVEHLV